MKTTCPKCNETIALAPGISPRAGAWLGGLVGGIVTRRLRGGVAGAAVGGLIGYLFEQRIVPAEWAHGHVCKQPTTAGKDVVDAEVAKGADAGAKSEEPAAE